jgi:hypothetical protein
MSKEARQKGRNGECVICINPGGEETWDRIVSAHSSPGAPFIVLNNAYSTSYGLGNKRGYEEVREICICNGIKRYAEVIVLLNFAFLSSGLLCKESFQRMDSSILSRAVGSLLGKARWISRIA